jgi:bacteriochlorophyll 4-vinyl reductase
MTDATIGRLLVAPLHQAITEVLPARVDFYEYWLTGEGLHGGTIGRAPMAAVLGFLRAERDHYAPVMSEAGRMAAEWAVDAMRAPYRRAVTALPRSLRARAALAFVKQVHRRGFSDARTLVKMRRGVARVEVRDSIFCQVREAQAHPLCGYHAALITGVLARFDLPADVVIEACHASGAPACVLIVTLHGSAPAANVS